MTRFHVTNGDMTVVGLREAGFADPIIPWRDVLHEGPVPGALPVAELRERRTRFLASTGWAAYNEVWADFSERDAQLQQATSSEEITLWFEHDLYDQLQMIQILDRLAEMGASSDQVTLIGIDQFPGIDRFMGLGQLSGEQLRSLDPARRRVSSAQFACAREAWHAFTSPTPDGLAALVQRDTLPLPFLRDALVRILQEYPSILNGLGLTAQLTLDVLATMECDPVELFQSVQNREDAPFLGDSSFWWHLGQLISAPRPLVRVIGSETFALFDASADLDAFLSQRLRLTDDGWAVLSNEADAVALNGIDRWIGGVHLRSDDGPRRWDPQMNRLVAHS